MEELVNLFVNNGIAVAVIVYFIYRDNKFMVQLQQTLQTLVDTVQCLHEAMEKGGKNGTD